MELVVCIISGGAWEADMHRFLYMIQNIISMLGREHIIHKVGQQGGASIQQEQEIHTPHGEGYVGGEGTGAGV
jgi:hypothetical protein